MFNPRGILLVAAVVALSAAIAASAQTLRAAGAEADPGRSTAAPVRATAPTAQPAMQRTLLTGTMRFSVGGVNTYLVVGKEKALLIDTGNPGDISPEETNAFTSLPILVVNTHAHPDHSGSNNRFVRVYIHEADLEAGKRYSGGSVELIPIKEGHVFDLGGKKLEVIEVPGHAPGSICLLDAQDKLLFGGDTANGETWAHISNVPLETYRKSMVRLLERKDQYDRVLPGHGDARPVSYLDELVACADEILAGKVDPTAQPAAQGGILQGSLLHRYRSATIRYNPNNLREKTN